MKIKKQFSDTETLNKEGQPKLILKPRKTHVSSKQIDIIDLFSNNVVSERVRVDPRDDESGDKGEAVFETVQEVDSDEQSDIQNMMDEDMPNSLKIERYASGKHMSNLNKEDLIKSDSESFSSSKLSLQKSQSRDQVKNNRKSKTLKEVVYEEIDEDTFNELYEGPEPDDSVDVSI